jgi:hypothetical protein
VLVRHLVESKLAHSRSARCFADFSGDRVNCSNTITEEVGLSAGQCLPDHTLYRRPQISHECIQWLIVLEIHADTVFVHRTFFQNSSITPELSCVARKTPVQPPFNLTVLSFDKVALAFM